MSGVEYSVLMRKVIVWDGWIYYLILHFLLVLFFPSLNQCQTLKFLLMRSIKIFVLFMRSIAYWTGPVCWFTASGARSTEDSWYTYLWAAVWTDSKIFELAPEFLVFLLLTIFVQLNGVGLTCYHFLTASSYAFFFLFFFLAAVRVSEWYLVWPFIWFSRCHGNVHLHHCQSATVIWLGYHARALCWGTRIFWARGVTSAHEHEICILYDYYVASWPTLLQSIARAFFTGPLYCT